MYLIQDVEILYVEATKKLSTKFQVADAIKINGTGHYITEDEQNMSERWCVSVRQMVPCVLVM